LDLDQVRDLLRTMTGALPTTGTLHALHDLSIGRRDHLVDITRLGLDEGWLERTDGFLVTSAPPIGMDRDWARAVHERISVRTTPAEHDFLHCLALRGPIPLRETMGDPSARAVTIALERTGLIRVVSSRILLSSHVIHLAISLSATPSSLLTATWQRALAADEPGRDAFSAAMAGIPLSTQERVRGALLAYRVGYLAQARHLLYPGDDEQIVPTELSALIEAAAGRPRTALRALQASPARGSAGNQVVTRVIRTITAPQVEVPEITVPEDSLSPEEHELLTMSRIFGASSSRGAQERIPIPGASTTAPASHGDTCARVAWAHRRALMGDSIGAQDLLRGIHARDLSALSPFSLSWCVERIGVARLLSTVDQEPFSPALLAETPVRQVLCALPMSTVNTIGALVHGEEDAALRARMSELWTLFETTLPMGPLARSVIDALDLATQGPRSAMIIGPPGVTLHDPAENTGPSMIQALVTAGELLRCPPQQLLDIPDARSLGALPGVHRVLLRTVVLRRTATLSPPIAAALADRARVADVEPEVVALADAIGRGSLTDHAEALQALRSRYPGLNAQPTPRDRRNALLLRSLSPAGSAALERLTARERAVALHLLSGDSTGQTAEGLGIGRRTVETHVRNLYHKLEVHSRTELRAELLS
jgi:DNA-binding CsgD family transcriptional regulator